MHTQAIQYHLEMQEYMLTSVRDTCLSGDAIIYGNICQGPLSIHFSSYATSRLLIRYRKQFLLWLSTKQTRKQALVPSHQLQLINSSLYILAKKETAPCMRNQMSNWAGKVDNTISDI